MDCLNLAMIDLADDERRRLRASRADVADLCDCLHMGSELDWASHERPGYGNTAAGWPSYAGLDALAGLNAVWARLWGPWYGQRPQTVPVRARDALGEVILLADKRNH